MSLDPAPWVFAAKTTVAALLALLVAFTFNLDQPQWTLLTVFVVSQPQRDGLILAKSFYRIIGTVVGATVALLFVASFAQDRVLFLGALAIWLGLCTFGSQYARNLTSYSFVLAGYTVAIVGIAGALDPDDAFYIATARVTEISLGISVTGAISHLILPNSLATSLWQAVSVARKDLFSCAVTLLSGGDTRSQRMKLLGHAIACESLSASAIFEDTELRTRRNDLRRVDMALIQVAAMVRSLGRQLEGLPPETVWARRATEQAIGAIRSWGADPEVIPDVAGRLHTASANLPSVQQICRDRCLSEPEMLSCVGFVGNLREFLTAVGGYAMAYRDFMAGTSRPAERVRFARANDTASAAWAGLRAALAVGLVSWFWIITAWPTGSTAAILASVATARLATMGHAVPIARAGAVIFALAALPAFIVIEVLLPLASDFATFALVVGPMVFACALLIAHQRTTLIGYLSGLLFASVGLFQDRMAYDPIGLINITIAAVLAATASMVMWAVIAPETPEAAYYRYARTVRRALERMTTPRTRVEPAGFDARIAEAIDLLRGRVLPDQRSALVAYEMGAALLGMERELTRMRQGGRPGAEPTARGLDIPQFKGRRASQWLQAMRRATRATVAGCLSELRDDSLAPRPAQIAATRMVAALNLQETLEDSRSLILGRYDIGAEHAA